MTNKLTEQQVLSQLNIPNFRYITKDKIMTFASMLQNMEPEVAKKALEQFPEFARMMLEVIHDYKDVLDKALTNNTASVKQCYDMYNVVLETLKNVLKKMIYPLMKKVLFG